MERAATAGRDRARSRRCSREAVDAGAFGFSTTILNQHIGYQGRPLACRNASRDELKAYANVLKETRQGRDRDRAHPQDLGDGGRGVRAASTSCSTESGRPVTFLALFDRDDIPDACRDTLRKASALIAGAPPADLAAAADPRDQHAQPVLVRRLPELEARLRRQVEGGAGARSTPTRPSATISARS